MSGRRDHPAYGIGPQAWLADIPTRLGSFGRTIPAMTSFPGVRSPRASNSGAPPKSLSRFTSLRVNQAGTQRITRSDERRKQSRRRSPSSSAGAAARQPRNRVNGRLGENEKIQDITAKPTARKCCSFKALSPFPNNPQTAAKDVQILVRFPTHHEADFKTRVSDSYFCINFQPRRAHLWIRASRLFSYIAPGAKMSEARRQPTGTLAPLPAADVIIASPSPVLQSHNQQLKAVYPIR
jgi:hypothetical protein